jgi:hypothetical protein
MPALLKPSAREIRRLYKSGQVKMNGLPVPPEEWNEMRRERMKVAIRCATLFLMDDLAAEPIRQKLRLGRISKVRVGQYVRKGLEFFKVSGSLTGL